MGRGETRHQVPPGHSVQDPQGPWGQNKAGHRRHPAPLAAGAGAEQEPEGAPGEGDEAILDPELLKAEVVKLQLVSLVKNISH